MTCDGLRANFINVSVEEAACESDSKPPTIRIRGSMRYIYAAAAAMMLCFIGLSTVLWVSRSRVQEYTSRFSFFIFENP